MLTCWKCTQVLQPRRSITDPLQQSSSWFVLQEADHPWVSVDPKGRLKLSGCTLNEPEQDRHGFPPQTPTNFAAQYINLVNHLLKTLNLEPLTPRVPTKLLFHRLVHKLEGSMVLGVGPSSEEPLLISRVPSSNTIWPRCTHVCPLFDMI